MNVPVITIDGASASGKGTIAAKIAAFLGFYYLDSGILYRLLACSVLQHQIDALNEKAILDLAVRLSDQFENDSLSMDGKKIDELAIRAEKVSQMASKVAKFLSVRVVLLDCQRKLRRQPGLVAEGRDMGTVVFPDASLKIYLMASAEERARRRYNQLIKNGEPANLASVRSQIIKRDRQDMLRASSPLKAASDAKLLDTSCMGIEEVIQQVLLWWQGLV